MVCLNPVGPTSLRDLDSSVGAPEQHDFAVRESTVRQHAVCSLTDLNPPCDNLARSMLPRPPHPAPRLRRWPTPLNRDRTGLDMRLIWVGRKQEYFCMKDWTTQISLRSFSKFDFSRNRF